jgi:hypothetical protein
MSAFKKAQMNYNKQYMAEQKKERAIENDQKKSCIRSAALTQYAGGGIV